jgi:hypothetical protein
MEDMLIKRLKKIELELEKCRTSSYVDGWQTQKHAKKSRKRDILAQEKIKIQTQLNDL